MASSPLQISSEKDFAVISNKHMDKVMGHMAVYHQNQSATLTTPGFFKSSSESHVFSTVTFLKHQLRLKNKKAAFNSKLLELKSTIQVPTYDTRHMVKINLITSQKAQIWARKEKKEESIHILNLYFFPQMCTSIFHDPCCLLILSCLWVIAELMFFYGFLLLVFPKPGPGIL